ncbi:MAG: DUF4398 domain-containing protein, partial [Xanthomonadales bacterium]|nr:DUF4398 domain-containing protein [Xanthomonadales bacterium]
MSVLRAVMVVFAALLLAACAGQPKKDLALEQVRNELERLKADENLQGYAPLALGEAERALRQAELSSGNDTQRLHLIYMADRRIQIARTVAQREQLNAEYDRLEAERNQLLVRASQLEAEQARLEAEQARMMSQATAEDAERARQQAAEARERELQSSRTAELAQEEAEQAKALAQSQATAAELAQREADLA